jgi:hypothetical protein
MTDQQLPTVGPTDGSSAYYNGPIWNAFGLTYAAYLVVPRRTLQSMPQEWQERFVALMTEAYERLPDGAFPEYSVQRKEAGRFVTDPLRDYRHTGPIKPVTTLATVKPPRNRRTRLRPDTEHKDCPHG